VRRRVVSGLQGRGVSSYVGLIVVALLAGLTVPMVVAAYFAGRESLPPSCHSGVASPTSLDGAVTWADGPILWFADGDLGRARRLASFAPPRPQLQASPGASPNASPSPSTIASPEASPAGGATPTPSASPSPAIPTARIEAAAITPDHALVAFLLSNPPDHLGTVSLVTVSPQSPPGTAPAVLYSNNWQPQAGQRAEVVVLPQNRILFMIPARYDPPETSKRVVGVVQPGDSPKLLEVASEHDFVSTQHSLWPETKDYKLPPPLPRLRDRVLGPDGVAAGEEDLTIRTPLIQRTLHAIKVGHAGKAATSVVCVASETLTPAAMSPDAHRLAIVVGDGSYILDLGGGRGLAYFTAGRVLDWRG
jgi:hypothetical protein